MSLDFSCDEIAIVSRLNVSYDGVVMKIALQSVFLKYSENHDYPATVKGPIVRQYQKNQNLLIFDILNISLTTLFFPIHW